MNKKIFSDQDRAYLKKQGISFQKAAAQIQSFKKGFCPTVLVRPCTIGDGIIRLSSTEQKTAVKIFSREKKNFKILKFVPASGAASRMFQPLESSDPKHAADKIKFLRELPHFAFYKKLKLVLKKRGYGAEKLRRNGRLHEIVEALLDDKGLGYRNAPKGMILFHGTKTAFEEHLREAALLAGQRKDIYVHFTVPEEARTKIRKHLSAADRHEKKIKITDSVQSSATNQLAAEKNGLPVYSEDGKLLLRPAGHGALLQNLGKQNADIIFVKNIDNILPAATAAESDRWKKILGGIFIETQRKIFSAQRILAGKSIKPAELLDVLKTASALGWSGWGLGAAGARNDLKKFFSRPLRVCGMVPNSGEPGGGPFWTRSSKENVSPQIVESAEVDLKDDAQRNIFKKSTHFNPVDFVCGLYDFRRKKYNIEQFVDSERGMISKKNYHGREIRVMELPGLWNGGMAKWLTVFVEIPAATFSPVKTVLDLLRPEHQGRKRKKK